MLTLQFCELFLVYTNIYVLAQTCHLDTISIQALQFQCHFPQLLPVVGKYRQDFVGLTHVSER